MRFLENFYCSFTCWFSWCLRISSSLWLSQNAGWDDSLCNLRGSPTKVFSKPFFNCKRVLGRGSNQHLANHLASWYTVSLATALLLPRVTRVPSFGPLSSSRKHIVSSNYSPSVHFFCNLSFRLLHLLPYWSAHEIRALDTNKHRASFNFNFFPWCVSFTT